MAAPGNDSLASFMGGRERRRSRDVPPAPRAFSCLWELCGDGAQLSADRASVSCAGAREDGAYATALGPVLPRTGTTYLHRLLSLDPTSRCPTTWELVDVVPVVPDDPVKDKAKRIKYVQRAIDDLKSIVPHIDAIHDNIEEVMLAARRGSANAEAKGAKA